MTKENDIVSEESVRKIKYTLPTILLTIPTIILFILKVQETSLNFESISNYEYWRVITAMFYSANIYFFFGNIVLLFFLSLLREPKKSSFPYFCDFFIKNILIFSLSIVLFLIVFWSSKVFGSFFETYSNKIISENHGGVFFFAISEILIALNLLSKRNSENEKFFFKNTFFLIIVLIIISAFVCRYLAFWSALIVASLEICGFLDFHQCLQQSKVNYIFENKFFRLDFFLYFYYDFHKNNNYYENRKLMQNDNSFTLKNDRNLVSIDNEDNECNKSRYEEVNVGDYVHDNDKKKNPKHDESFEI
jgi:hypothetical protein